MTRIDKNFAIQLRKKGKTYGEIRSQLGPISKATLTAWFKNVTGIPEKQFQKIYIKKTSLHHRKNILYNGTCAIVVCDKNLFRRISSWKLGLIDFFKCPGSSMDRTRDF